MKYLTPQDILVIHSEIIDATSGRHGIRDLGLLISITERPRASFGGKEAYKSIFEKAAVYLESLALYHVFVDGNKRTGIASCARFLFINGFELRASNSAVKSFVLKVVVEGLDIPLIVDWLKKNSCKLYVKR